MSISEFGSTRLTHRPRMSKSVLGCSLTGSRRLRSLKYTLRGHKWLILKGLEIQRKKRVNLSFMFGRYVLKALVNRLGKVLEGRQPAAGQAFFLDELPQALDQVQVGRI